MNKDYHKYIREGVRRRRKHDRHLNTSYTEQQREILAVTSTTRCLTKYSAFLFVVTSDEHTMKLLYTETRQSRAASRQGLISHLIHTTGSFYRQVSVTLVLTTEITSTEEYKTQEQTLKLTLTRASCMALLTATYRKLKATEQNSLGPVYTIQPVVKPVVKPV